MSPTRLKVCCIQDEAEARMAIRFGASAIGLVSKMPSGPGPIDEDQIERIARTVPPSIATFLLTSLEDAPSIIAQQRRCRTNTIQLVDRLESGAHEILRKELPGISLVQVIHVTGPESVDEAVAVAPFVDAILLDSGNQKLAIKELGGTGRVHDWTISRKIREAINVPLFLAGGLRPHNVKEAVEKVRPFGIDVCSGLRTDNRLDEAKLAAFVEQIRLADE